MVVGASEVLGYATEALVLAGDLVAAEAQLKEALAIASDVNERVYLPQLCLMQAAIAHARGDRIAAKTSQRQALEEARSQQAPWLELMALNALVVGNAANAGDRKALATLVERMPEASDTDAIATARTLLAK
jgi:ATP/maltotriose-dependent transcriptional regulator MalT